MLIMILNLLTQSKVFQKAHILTPLPHTQYSLIQSVTIWLVQSMSEWISDLLWSTQNHIHYYPHGLCLICTLRGKSMAHDQHFSTASFNIYFWMVLCFFCIALCSWCFWHCDSLLLIPCALSSFISTIISFKLSVLLWILNSKFYNWS